MTTALYMLAGWMLLNVLFAAGMYFRPVRKAAPNGRVPDTDTSTVQETLNSRTGSSGQVPTWNRSEIPSRIGQPGLVGKVLFFGLWLSGRRHPV